MEDSRPRRRPKRTWRKVVQKECKARKLKREDAVDRSSPGQRAIKLLLLLLLLLLSFEFLSQFLTDVSFFSGIHVLLLV